MNSDVQSILDRDYFSYQPPLKQAWTWNRESTEESLKKGEELSLALKARFPHVLQVRYELAFSLVRQKRRAEAIAELQESARAFPILDEDCLSLQGRCHKDDGDECLSRDQLALAEHEYRKAEECYQKAYDLRQDRFPGINIAALRLIRASLLGQLSELEPSQSDSLRKQAKELLRLSEQMASELLASSGAWQERLPDDNLWTLATRADAHLLLREWAVAEQFYQEALTRPNRQPFHAESMQIQVLRLQAAFARLGIALQGAIADPVAFFSSDR
jgi:tetratricopeptide (TPR) repeat protein